MRTFPIVLAVSLALSSASAFAANKTASQDKQPPTMKADGTPSADTKYCLSNSPDEATGSRIYTRECHTKAEWARRGVDVTAPEQQQQ